MSASRVCSKCGVRKGAEFFPKPGRGAQCNACKAAYMRDYWVRRAADKQGDRPFARVREPKVTRQPVPRLEPKAAPVVAELRAAMKPQAKPELDADLPIRDAPKQPPLPIPPTTNYQRDASERERGMIEHGTYVVRQFAIACFAVDVITSGWWAMNRSEAQ